MSQQSINKFQYEIRLSKKEDIEQLYSIETTAYGKSHWSKDSFLNELNSNYSKIFVAEIPNINKIIGYAGYWLIGFEGHITTIAIDANFRRRHVADILLYNIIKDAIANNIKWLTLEVRASNIPALCLYNKFKFNQLGIRKKYYQDNNEDAIILWTDDISDKSYQILIDSIYSNIQNDSDADIFQYA